MTLLAAVVTSLPYSFDIVICLLSCLVQSLCQCHIYLEVNPFNATDLFLYPLKTSENGRTKSSA